MSKKIYIATFSEKSVETALEHRVGLELNHVCISENLDDDKVDETIDQMKKDMAASQAKDFILHGPFTEICPGSIDHKVVELGFKRLEEAYEVCRRLKIDRMVVHTGYMPLIYYKEWHLEKSLIFWKKFMEDKPENFHLYIENVFEDEPFMLKDLIEGIGDERVKICLDVGHANVLTAEDFPVTKWIEILGKDIGHFHLHNNDGTKDLHNSLTSGEMNMEKILAASIKFCNTDVTYTVESRECQQGTEWLTCALK